MTDKAAQIARLNTLARKIWPRAHVIYRPESGSVSVATDVGDEGTATERVFLAGHPLALPALEAALRVMAGEPSHQELLRELEALAERWEAAMAPTEGFRRELRELIAKLRRGGA